MQRCLPELPALAADDLADDLVDDVWMTLQMMCRWHMSSVHSFLPDTSPNLSVVVCKMARSSAAMAGNSGKENGTFELKSRDTSAKIGTFANKA